MSFPKTMRWADGTHRWVRPVHWVVALHGEEVLSLEILERNGLGRTTSASNVLMLLAQVEEKEGRLEAAERLLRDAIDIATSALGHDTAAQIDPTDLLVRVLRRAGRDAEADALDAHAAEIRRKSGQVASTPIGVAPPTSRIDKE